MAAMCTRSGESAGDTNTRDITLERLIRDGGNVWVIGTDGLDGRTMYEEAKLWQACHDSLAIQDVYFDDNDTCFAVAMDRDG